MHELWITKQACAHQTFKADPPGISCLTHLSRMEFPIFIIWTGPFPV